MSSPTSKTLAVSVIKKDDQLFTNLAYCARDNIHEFAGDCPTSCLMGGLKPHDPMAIINDNMVVTLRKDETLGKDQIALNPEQMELVKVAESDEVSLKAFVPPSAGFNIDTLTIDVVEIKGSNSIPIKQITASEFERKFIKRFNKQVFSLYQNVYFRIKGTLYKCTVVDVSILSAGVTMSFVHKRGMVRRTTSVLVNFSDQHMGEHITGAYIYEGILRKDLKTDSLEEELMSLGIAGMTSQLTNILSLAFETRMTPPWTAKRLKLKHVKGMLLYGPPGSGKTLIAQSLCKLLKVKGLKIVNGPEVLNKFVGQSEANIRALFDDAILDEKTNGLRSGLHVIVFDEIDSIASRRAGTEENKTYDKIVNQLLSYIDGVNEVSNVFIIGTTNRKEILDEALLRPGRLELHIEVKYPDEQGLAKILEMYTKEFREASLIDDDVDLQEIARMAYGGSGATMASVARNAYSYARKKHSPTSLFMNPAEMNFKLSMDDFIHGLETAMPGLNQTSTEEVPSSSTEMAEIHRDLKEHGKLKKELSFYKEEKNKLEKTVDVLGAIVNNKASEVEMVRASASGLSKRPNTRFNICRKLICLIGCRCCGRVKVTDEELEKL